MEPNLFTKAEARRFILLKQGLLGPTRYVGKQGVLDYVRAAGCIQFDPVDVCGMNADLVLQARVKGYRKEHLQELLYKDRLLYDHFDKQMSVIPTEDYPAFFRNRRHIRQWGRVSETIDAVAPKIRDLSAGKESFSTKSFDLGRADWYWGETSLSRATLEAMYYSGELLIHHKEGKIRHFAPAENLIPKALLDAPDPHPDEASYHAWRVLRRVGAVGLLWDKGPEAYLMIGGLTAAKRREAFARLLEEGSVVPASVEGLKDAFYLKTEDLPLATLAKEERRYPKKATLVAPLDAMIWDRNLIRAIFGFDYVWEIYTPPGKMKYAHYALPLLYGETFVGRVELRTLRKEDVLSVKNVWLEDGFKPTQAFQTALTSCFERFAAFSGLSAVRIEEH
ncbi:MAG: crosslink repair DNA glycosylase YcaQ family protein [Candidatus Izemoplasmatales bacterium]